MLTTQRNNQNQALTEADVLSPDQIRSIARALQAVGEFGEVRLIKAKGKLRFIQRVTSGALLKSGAPADGRQRA